MPNSAASAPLEFYKARFEVENSLTRGVLKAIPADKLDYRPHERSPSTGQIAWTIVRGLFIRMDMAAQGTSDVILEPHPSFQEIFDRFEDASRRHAAQLASWSKQPGREPASYAPAAVLRSSGRQATSYGCSTSTRSITAASSPPICAPWGPRSHRFTERRATRYLNAYAKSKYPPVHEIIALSVSQDRLG